MEWDPYEELLITTGVSEGLDLAARAVINPGDEVIVADPSYAAHAPAIVLAGGKPVSVTTYASDGFALDPAAVESAVTESDEGPAAGVSVESDGCGAGALGA